MFNLALAYMSKHDFARAGYWVREGLDIAPDDAQLRQIQHRLWFEARWYKLRQWPQAVFQAFGFARRGENHGKNL